MKYMSIFVMGRPGAGKDTQAELLAKHFDLASIETSDLIRAKLKNDSGDSEVQKEKEIFESGELNTPSWVVQVVREHVENLARKNFHGKGGIIFSGSPRTTYEAETLLPFLENIFGRERMVAIYLQIPEEDGIQRILKRAARPLDKDPKKLKVRMREYDERTKPVLNYMEKMGILSTVDGTPAVEEIFQNILTIVNEKLSL